jgi:hypothetical protein
MKRHRNLSLLMMFAFMIIQGCTHKTPSESTDIATTININPRQSSKIKLSDIIDDINIIRLETSDSSIIDEILGMKKAGNKYYIKTSDNVYIFDVDGEFERKLGEKGKGPNEILAVTNFYVDDKSHTIELYDGVNSKNILYDITGNVIQSTKHKYSHGYDFIKGPHGGYFFYLGFGADMRGELIFTQDLENEKYIDLLPYNKTLAKYLHFGDLVNFSHNKYGTYFTRSFSNIIYQLSDNNLFPKYNIDFDNSNLPDNILYGNYSDVREFMLTCLDTKYAFRIIGFFEMENLIIFGFHYNKKIWNAIYNKNERNCKVVSYFVDDFLGTEMEIESSFELLPKGFDNDIVFLSIDAYKIHKFISICKNSNDIIAKKVLDTIKDKGLEKIKVTDNPIILEIKLK